MYRTLIVGGRSESQDLYRVLSELSLFTLLPPCQTMEEAGETIKQGPPDIVFAGDHLADGSGLELNQKLKEAYNHPMMFFLLSRNIDMKMYQEAVKAGVILLKEPIDIQKVLSAIEKSSLPEKKIQQEQPSLKPEDTQIVEDEEQKRIEAFHQPSYNSMPVERQEPKKKIERKKETKIILVYSPNGGVGKTTLSVNLAVYIECYLNQHVALLEFTKQAGHMITHFDLNPIRNVSQILSQPRMPGEHEIMNYLLEDQETGLMLLPSPAFIEGNSLDQQLNAENALRIIQSVEPHVDVMIVDMGTLWDDMLIQLMDYADDILLISTMRRETLQNCHYVPHKMQSKQVDTSKLIHVLNMVKKGTGMKEEEALSFVDASATHSIGYDAGFEKIEAERRPHIIRQKKGKFMDDISELAQELIHGYVEEPSKGLFTKVKEKMTGTAKPDRREAPNKPKKIGGTVPPKENQPGAFVQQSVPVNEVAAAAEQQEIEPIRMKAAPVEYKVVEPVPPVQPMHENLEFQDPPMNRSEPIQRPMIPIQGNMVSPAPTYTPTHHRQSIIVMGSAKGGVGKSTLTMNMALYFQRRGYRTVIVDFDEFQGNVANMLRVPTTISVHTWEHVTINHMDEVSVNDMLVTHPSGLKVLPANPSIIQSEAITLNFKTAERILLNLRRYFDVILIDTDPRLTHAVATAFDLATHIFMIGTMDKTIYPRYKDRCHEILELGIQAEKVYFAINRSRRKYSKEDERIIMQAIPFQYITRIPEMEDLTTYSEQGKAYLLEKAHSEFAQGVKKMIEIIQPVEQEKLTMFHRFKKLCRLG